MTVDQLVKDRITDPSYYTRLVCTAAQAELDKTDHFDPWTTWSQWVTDYGTPVKRSRTTMIAHIKAAKASDDPSQWMLPRSGGLRDGSGRKRINATEGRTLEDARRIRKNEKAQHRQQEAWDDDQIATMNWREYVHFPMVVDMPPITTRQHEQAWRVALDLFMDTALGKDNVDGKFEGGLVNDGATEDSNTGQRRRILFVTEVQRRVENLPASGKDTLLNLLETPSSFWTTGGQDRTDVKALIMNLQLYFETLVRGKCIEIEALLTPPKSGLQSIHQDSHYNMTTFFVMLGKSDDVKSTRVAKPTTDLSPDVTDEIDCHQLPIDVSEDGFPIQVSPQDAIETP
jgi:hypothetical protein